MSPSSAAEMADSTFPAELRFQKTWRAYQQRVLDGLEGHLNDRRLHVVAAPGSGKTVLGLEILRRLGRATLVLAPTLTIREQWVERLVQLFLPPDASRPPWVSTDLRAPALLTVATYQGLHAAYSGEDEIEEDGPVLSEQDLEEDCEPTKRLAPGAEANGQVQHFRAVLRAIGFGTVVVDEAHHLRSEWWKTITAVVEELGQPTIVALTATPPYDVIPSEWERYERLCGPVDAEVSIPELVQQGDLCPHQDYVYFTAPATPESQRIEDFRRHVSEFVLALRGNPEFLALVTQHPWVQAPESHVEEILENPAYASSMAVFLGHVLDEPPLQLLRVLGTSVRDLPALEHSWLEQLLTGCLFRDDERFPRHPVLRDIKRRLQEMGAIERRNVTLVWPQRLGRILSTSVTKLEAIAAIVREEASTLQDKLRLVVLTDYIRRSEMPEDDGSAPVFDDIGVVPIFEILRRLALQDVRLGVLSGSLVILPLASAEQFKELAARRGADVNGLRFAPLRHDPAYVVVQAQGSLNQEVVRMTTELFERGGVHVLVGTKSLLGEGWDAPAINALILATFVGSYMLSNQMRGRSVRIAPRTPDKTANIWHLVCVEPGLAGPGSDYELLCRRFKSFAAAGLKRLVIENGVDRLDLPEPPFTRTHLAAINQDMLRTAADRAGMAARWREALAAGDRHAMVEAARATERMAPRSLVFANTIIALVWQGMALAAWVFSQIVEAGARTRQPLKVLAAAAAIATLVALPFLLKSLWLTVKHRSLESSLTQVARALLHALIDTGVIDRDSAAANPSPPRVWAERSEHGTVLCSIEGVSSYERTVFLRALHEILNPVENPGYLLARQGRLWFLQREDYHAVPAVLGRRKEYARAFHRRWRAIVGPAQLVYTRTIDGRRMLLRARTHSLAAKFQARAERVSAWK